ncbi:Cell division and transport-associated protein TolA [Methylobacillus rhizosphaerae]|uniref:Cell division and transport-associated protein TolA n=1 Tax=Methylobacillus rhizosphaerae TaxID=551994 RepID=A0A238XUS2_9PROT|nr:energy transducer TonB [Methylobacillus rhizosphaerae]SNR62687.1 Cell division and transport-associated protein TolA [Methylobacillus rhizosphaerae]
MKLRKANPYKVRAAALSLLVHLLLLVLLLVSFDWKTHQPMRVAEVDLWDALPADKPVAKPPKPEPMPEPPKPEPKPEPAPEPKPEPKPAEPEPQAEIQVKKEPEKPKQPEKKPEPKKPEPKKPEPKPEPKKPEPKKEDKVKLEELKKLQQELLEENSRPAPAQKQGPAQDGADVANQSEIDKYLGQLQAKIKRNVNRQFCGTGKVELEVGISLMPTGDVIGMPQILRSSGLPACDEAIERAILQSQPLPVPPQPELFSRFRDLKLKFRPNEDG